jgi:uncharacterized protein (DUF4415 family)
MNEWNPPASLKQAAEPDEKLAIDPDILAWFKARGAGWQDEINGVLAFYKDTSSIRPRNRSRRFRTDPVKS